MLPDSPARRTKGARASSTASVLKRSAGTGLIKHVSVRKYTSLQLFVETLRVGG